MAQHKATLRQSLRSALKHKAAADAVLDVIADTQQRVSDLANKISTDNLTAIADYTAESALSNTLDSDANSVGQHKRSIREVLTSSLAHKAVADDILDSLEEIDLAIQNMTIDLVADIGAAPGAVSGTTFTDYNVTVDEADATLTGMQNKASRRRIMRSAVSHNRLGDLIADSLEELQSNVNFLNSSLDTATGSFVDSLTLTIIDPDAP